MEKQSVLLFVLLLSVLSVPAILAQEDDEDAIGADVIAHWLEALIFVFIIVAVLLNITVIHKFKTSTFGMPFIYILSGMILLGLSRVVILLYDLEILEIQDITLQVWWHLLFYLAMVSFLFALTKIISTAKGQKLVGFTKNDSIILGLFGLLAAILLLGAEAANQWVASLFDGSFMDKGGVVHFIAFGLAGFAAAKLFWIRINQKYSGKIIAAIIIPFLLFLALMSLNHFWELLTESWKVILVPEATIETVEQFFWLPAFICMTYGFIRLRKEMRKALTK